MSEDTGHLVKGSLLGRLGLSVRGCVVVMFVVTLCALSVMGKEVSKEFGNLTMLAVGYYFMHKQSDKQ